MTILAGNRNKIITELWKKPVNLNIQRSQTLGLRKLMKSETISDMKMKRIPEKTSQFNPYNDDNIIS